MCDTSSVDVITIESTPKLKRPTLVAAFRGWNDAGGAASLAAGYLRAVTDAERFAVIDPDPFIDYQQTRPSVTLEDGHVRSVEWPETEFLAAEPHDIVIVVGPEPNMRWRAYSDAICQLARKMRVELVVTLGALLADTPHTRPVEIGRASCRERV